MAQLQEVFLFQPTSISGCQLWLDAADTTSMSLTGSVVNTWNDKSGSGITYISSNSPTLISNALNGKSVMNFVGSSSQYFYGGAASSCELIHTHFFVYFNSVQSIGQTLFGSSNQFSIIQEGGGRCYQDVAGFTDGAVIQFQTGGAYRMISALVSSSGVNPTTNGTVYFNGTQITLQNNSAGYNVASKPTNLYIGAGNTKYTGTVAEGIIYAGLLTTAQRQQVEGYLAWKWGLQGSLPASHPYKAYRPIAQTPVPTNIPPMPINIQNTLVFNPASISGCAIWLDATDVNGNGIQPTSSSAVSSWADKSGNGRNFVQTTAGNRPTYGTFLSAPGISFTGASSTRLSNAYIQTGSGARTTFIVFYDVSTSANTFGNPPLFNMAQTFSVLGEWRTAFDGANNYLGIDAVQGAYLYRNIPNVTTMRSARCIGMWGYNASSAFNTSYVYGNGTQFTTLVNSAANTGTLNVQNTGVSQVGGARTGYVTSVISEVLHYTSELTTAQRQQVEGYLAWKWGLTSSLPENHPYRVTPFFPIAPSLMVTTGSTNMWQPTQISGCALWLDAMDVSSFTPSNPTNGTAISQWNDKSGNSRHATQSSPSNRPVYSSSDISVDTTVNPRFFNLTSMPSSPYNVFVVAKPVASNSDWRTLLRTSTADPGMNIIVLQAGNNNIGYWTSTAFSQFGTYTWSPSTRNLFFARMNSNKTMNGSLNGDISLTAATAAGTASDVVLYLGALVNSGAVSQQWGNINEVIFYTSTLSTNQRQLVEGYLAWKWGLQGSLPSNHPFKLWPPPPS